MASPFILYHFMNICSQVVLKNSLNAFDEEKELVEVTQAASMPLKRKKRELMSLTNVLDALEEEKETVEVTDKQPRWP
jgi:hypothetical protein